jgi:transcriptional regulator with XRE-family HTH domain
MKIGRYLRQVRQQHGMSLREVAERSGFAASFLSLVENDKASPSVASLECIAAVFNLSLAEFFQGVGQPTHFLVPAAERKSYDSEWSNTVVEILAQRPHGELAPMLLKLAAGARSGKAPCPSLVEEFVLVLEGRVCVILEEGEKDLGIGDSCSLAAGTPRAWVNRSDTEAVLLVVGHRTHPVLPADAPPQEE